MTDTQTRTPLYECEHPYYCTDQNYYLNQHQMKAHIEVFDDIPSMVEELGRLDRDWNLLFRWDWKVPAPDDTEREEMYGETVDLYFFAQRKGFHFIWRVDRANRDDEPLLYFALRERWEHLTMVWGGVA